MAGSIIKSFRPMKVGVFGILKFCIKHYYFFVLLLVLLPTIMGSISQAIEEKNPAIPFIDLGITLANADSQIAADVVTLKENPEELIGSTKPSNGIWKTIVYYWGVFLVIVRELGYVWAIAFPFVIIFKMIRYRNTSETTKNVILTIVYGLIFVLVMNLIMIVRGLITGDLVPVMQEGISLNKQVLIIAIQALPFHGLFSLIQYVVNLSVTIA